VFNNPHIPSYHTAEQPLGEEDGLTRMGMMRTMQKNDDGTYGHGCSKYY
jgi:hypothetical protein